MSPGQVAILFEADYANHMPCHGKPTNEFNDNLQANLCFSLVTIPYNLIDTKGSICNLHCLLDNAEYNALFGEDLLHLKPLASNSDKIKTENDAIIHAILMIAQNEVKE